MDADSFILSVKTKDIIKDLKKWEDIFDFSNLDENHELLITKNQKVISKYKVGTPKNIWIDDFVCLRSKMYAFKLLDDIKNRFKGLSKNQSKKFIFEEYYICLFGGKYQQECDNYIIRSLNHDLQRVKKIYAVSI